MQRLGVFLDENAPFHKEYDSYTWGFPFKNPHYYYSMMNVFFGELERESDCNIIIKMHPKERYPAGFTVSPYGDRLHFHAPIDDAVTDILVQGADFVISHCSTAANIAEKYGVPLLLVTLDELEGRNEGAVCLARAKKNGTKVININRMWGE